MNQETRFPYRLDNVFFTSLQIRRLPQMPDQLNLKFSVDIRTQDQQFPDTLQVDIRFKTLEDPPLTIEAELVGLFVLVDGAAEPTHDIIPGFVNERALYMLWPYMAQMLRIVSGQMGTNPINIKTPYKFQVELSEDR